jgi:hypothetical protein
MLPRIVYEFQHLREQVLGPNICCWACPTSGHIGSGLRFRTAYDLSPASTPMWFPCLYILFHTTRILSTKESGSGNIWPKKSTNCTWSSFYWRMWLRMLVFFFWWGVAQCSFSQCKVQKILSEVVSYWAHSLFFLNINQNFRGACSLIFPISIY